jgi:hypothetical protein
LAAEQQMVQSLKEAYAIAIQCGADEIGCWLRAELDRLMNDRLATHVKSEPPPGSRTASFFKQR